MDLNEIQKFWWRDITGCHSFLGAIISALEENKSVLLKVPYDLPWRKSLRNEFQLSIRDNSNISGILYYEIDVQDQCPNQDPGNFLLEISSLSDKIKFAYRSTSKKPIHKVLIDNGALKNQIYWIKGFDKNNSEKWIEFCKNYTSSINNGLFVLEIPEQFCHEVVPSRALETVDYRNHVTEYDANLLNNIGLRQKKDVPIDLCPYIAALALKLCDFDVEVAADFLNDLEWRNEEPLTVLKRICQESNYAKRGAEKDSNHIFAYIRNNDISKINQKIWEAQIQSFFPIIEIERKEIVGLFCNEISNCLQNEEITQFGYIITNPSEIEIGTLYFLITSEYYSNYFNKLDDETCQRIRFLRECRNTLAHGKTIENDSIKTLLGVS